MSEVRVLVGTRKGAFVLTSDGKRERWDVNGPHFGGWEIYHLKGSPVDPDRLYASQGTSWFGQLIQRSNDGGKTWEPVGNKFAYDGVPGTHLWYDGTPHPWEFKRVWHLEPSLTDPDTVYAGVEDASLFRSADGGQSWQELPGLRGHASGSRWQPGAGVSTYTVMGDKTFDDSVCFRETDYDLGQGFAHMNYQRSKFRAEAMVRAAREHGLNWRIFRPGQIYGDSVTGAYPHAATRVTGLFYDLFKTAMDTGVMPEAYIHYDVVPVDYVSRGIIALSAGTENFFDVYHLTNPDAKSFAQVMGLLREIGYPIELLPESLYKQKLQSAEITKNGKAYSSAMLTAFRRWYFIAKVSFYGSAMTDCEYTRAKLETLGVRCAPLDRKLIETYVRAGIREGYFEGVPS